MKKDQHLKELDSYNQRLKEYEESIARLQNDIQHLQREAIHDTKTSLFSPAYLYARLSEEIVRSERYRHFLSVILIHVDLKSSQSTQQVTQELKKIGLELMTGLTRRTDIVAVYRKRQMAIILPETDQRGSQLLLHRYQMMFPNNGRRLSYCVMTYPLDASNIELVLNRLQELSEDLFRGSGRSIVQL